MKAVLLLVVVAVIAGVFIVHGQSPHTIAEIKSRLGISHPEDSVNASIPNQTQTASPSVGAFHAVSADGGMDIEIRQGSGTSITFKANPETLAKLKAEVVDGVLKLGVKDDQWTSDLGPVTAIIETPNLDAVTLNGSGKIDLTKLDTQKLAIAINGSSDVTAEGSAKAAMSFDIQGSGNIDSKHLQSDEVATSISGSGSADVNAAKKLEVSIAGSGNVRYFGASGRSTRT